MNRLSEFIDLARFKLYGFIANTADSEMRRRWGNHETASRANHQIAQETGHPEWGSSRGMCKRPLELSTETHACMFETLQFGAGWDKKIGHTVGNSFSVNLFDSVLHSHHIAAR